MKQFPRFSEAIILQSITQPQAKVILTALNAFARAIDNPEAIELIKYCKRTVELSKELKDLSTSIINL